MNYWLRAAWLVWGAIVLAAVGRTVLQRSQFHCGCYHVFADGGRHWLNQEPLYDHVKLQSLVVFRYSPLVGVLCAPLALLSDALGSAALRLINLAALLVGLVWWGRKLFPASAQKLRGQWLLLTALASGPALLDVQLNLLNLGMMLIALAAALDECWNCAALALGLAICLKCYPVSLALLFCCLLPRRLAPRMAGAMLFVLVLPFALQSPAYVLEQYHDWLHYGLNVRFAEDWFQDVMFLWQRWVGPMERSRFMMLSAVAGCWIALVTLLRRRHEDSKDLLEPVFAMACAWMMAFGPSTEATSYVLLAPAAALAAVRARHARHVAAWSRLVAAGAFALLALSQLQLLFPLDKPFHKVGAQPLAALLLLAVFACWNRVASWKMEPLSRGLQGPHVAGSRGGLGMARLVERCS